MKRDEGPNSTPDAEPRFVEGVDFYFEQGLTVLTAEYLRKRGFCCGNNCRHCPYPKDRIVQSRNSSNSL